MDELFTDLEKNAIVSFDNYNNPSIFLKYSETNMNDIPCNPVKFMDRYCWSGSNAFDLLGLFKSGLTPESSLYQSFRQMNKLYDISDIPTFKYKLTLSNSIAPSKTHVSDSGFDLTAVSLTKKYGSQGEVCFYDTGVQVEPPWGWYFEVVPRSSISKTGYMLANSVGIIDRSYQGNILIALRKMSPNVSDLELPCRIAQLIPRRIIHMNGIEVNEFNMTTTRGDGGFGSTNST